jgi:hypothetical protein
VPGRVAVAPGEFVDARQQLFLEARIVGLPVTGKGREEVDVVLQKNGDLVVRFGTLQFGQRLPGLFKASVEGFLIDLPGLAAEIKIPASLCREGRYEEEQRQEQMADSHECPGCWLSINCCLLQLH